MRKIDSIKIIGYIFPEFPNLIFHSGKFWVGENEVQEVYNNGSMSMVIYGVKRGKKKLLPRLRKQAVKCTIELNKYPF